MSLLPRQMADLGNRQPFFFQNSLLNYQSTMFTPEQLDAIKAATASCGLFASLISHSQRKQLPIKPFPLSNTHRSSGLSRSCKSSIASKKTTYSLFKRGTRVRLVDGSIQKVEGLRTADFLRAAKSMGTESSLQWVEVNSILKEDFPLNIPRDLVNIRFSLNINGCREAFNSPLASLPPITWDYQCNKEQPFFVQSHGWSSCDPQSTLSRFGLACRSLSVGDYCLVVVPSEIAKLFPSSTQLPPVDFKFSLNPLMFSTKWKDLFSDPPKYVNITLPNELDSVASLPQQPLDLKKEGTKPSPGNVPEYFSAASLAESPFKEAS
nr:ataxin 1 [Hymenolepis microstoma]